MKKLLLTAALVAICYPAYANDRDLATKSFRELNESTAATAAGDYVPYFDASVDAVVKRPAQTLFSGGDDAGPWQSQFVSFTSAELNAAGGFEVLPAVTGYQYQAVKFDLYPDAAVTTCDGIKAIDDLVANHDGASYWTRPSGYDGSFISFTSSSITYTSAATQLTSAASVSLDNIGSSCAGANNYEGTVFYTLAP